VSDTATPSIAKLTISFLQHCALSSIPVINGWLPFSYGMSKIMHHSILNTCGLRTPAAVVIRDVTQLQTITSSSENMTNAKLRWPLLLKPNAGEKHLCC
jgi:hypothetical protein